MTGGATLGLFVGPFVPAPLAPALLRAVEQVTVTVQDGARSGFQIVVVAGRDRGAGREDVAALHDGTFRIGNRVQVTASLAGRRHVLMDGIVTHLAVAPATEPNAARLTVTGEDLSVMLDLVEAQLSFPGMADFMIATLLLAPLVAYGVVPQVVPEPSVIVPLPTKSVPQRNGTALGILTEMAERWGYTFYVQPGPVRGASLAYWGPPIRAGVPQPALTWRMGAASNLGSVSFQSDGTKPKQVYGLVQDERFNVPIPIIGLPFTGQPLAATPAYVGNLPFLGVKRLSDDERGNVVAALWRATGEVFRSTKGAATASGELDVARYGHVLAARALVDIRGVGRSMDGSWYTQSVTHTVSRGSWKQSFTLEREGTGALVGKVARL
ncbi:hypothetical protein [Pseudonocardia sp.]|uniref:hypothetical protein n=1 Tax=Pseudonocardia sp. TaxID=60912 RepID=UPI003D15192B